MSRRTISLFDIFDLYEPAAVPVKHRERFLYEYPPVFIELSPDGHEELVNVECAVVVGVEQVEDERHVLLVDAHAEVLASLRELKQRDTLAAIVVHDREELLQADDTSDATGFNLVTE